MFKILIVEDNLNLQKLYSAILKANGYTTMTANNGAEALEVLKREHADLMILDVMMPVMDGYELTDMLRQGGSELPILMITAKSEQADKRAGFLVGIDDYMTKPIDEEEMLLRIKALLRRSKIVAEHKLEVGGTILHYDELSVESGGVTVTLPKKEFYLLYKLLPDVRIFSAVMPILIMGSIIFCPIFIDFSVVLPAVKYLKWGFLPTYFFG